MIKNNILNLLRKEFLNHKIEVDKNNRFIVDDETVSLDYQYNSDLLLEENYKSSVEEVLLNSIINEIKKYLEKKESTSNDFK